LYFTKEHKKYIRVGSNPDALSDNIGKYSTCDTEKKRLERRKYHIAVVADGGREGSGANSNDSQKCALLCLFLFVVTELYNCYIVVIKLYLINLP